MKKLSILLVVFLLVAGFIFAQEETTTVTQPEPQAQPQPQQAQPAEEGKKERAIELFNLEINVGFPVHWTNGWHDATFYVMHPDMMEDKFVTADTAIGLAMSFNFTKTFGLTFDMDLFYGAKLTGFSNPTSDYNSLFGLNIYLGPYFYLFNNNMLRIPLTVGAHMYYFNDDLWVPDLSGAGGGWLNRKDLQFGITVALAVQFHFSRSVYIFSRTNIAIDFIRYHTIRWYDAGVTGYNEDNHFDIGDVSWLIKPSIGLGIKF